MQDRKKELAGNLDKVRERIAAACRRVGRDPSQVSLVAVSKKKPFSDMEALIACGQKDFGENYVQELCEKYDLSGGGFRYHMIGHLQTNKVRTVLGKTILIHSVDSLRLAEKIEKESAGLNRVTDILVQVNIASEESKFGLNTDQVRPLLEEIGKMPHVHVCGLMASAPFVENPENNRRYFRKLHKLFVDIDKENMNNIDMNILSMGMTNDYEIAIEEGATMIRVGTGIFGAR